MRFLHVAPAYLPAWRYGGPILSVHGLCRALAARGHEVTVATTSMDGPGDSDVPHGRAVMVDGVAVHYFRSPFLRRLFYAPAMAPFLAQKAREVDVVHVHWMFVWTTVAAARAARRAGTPYVLSPRGMLVRELIRRRSSVVKRAWIAAFDRRNVECASAVHATSAMESREIAALGLRMRRVIELPNGVEPFDGAEEGGAVGDQDAPPLPDRYLLFLGRINWKKGLERLLAALAACPGVPLVIAGNDEEGYRPRLEALARELGVAERVTYAGFLRGAAKDRALREAVALVLASDSENFGNVVAEALARGTPVIVTPGVGAAEHVRRHACGLVAEADPAALAEAIRALWSDEALRRRLSANAGRAARALAWPAIAERFEAEYRSLLDAVGPRVAARTA